MSEQVLDTRTRQVDDSLRYFKDANGVQFFVQGPRKRPRKVIADDDPSSVLRLSKWLTRIVRFGPRTTHSIAFIGGGFCVLPGWVSLRRWATIDVYEIEQDIIDWNNTNNPLAGQFNFIVGDYLTTLTGTYEVIVYDLVDPPDEALLNSHLAAGGLLLGVD